MEASIKRCSGKWIFWKFKKKSKLLEGWVEPLKNTCSGFIFSKDAGFWPAALLKNEFPRGCFFSEVSFQIFLRRPFLPDSC